MNKLVIATGAAFCFAALALTGCSDKAEQKQSAASPAVLKVAATPVPAGEILTAMIPEMKKKGIDLKVVEFTDYISPNSALADKSVDANFFQHIPFLNNTVASKGYKIVNAGPVLILPMAAYSRKVKDLKDLKDGAQVTIPNDPTNGSRALLLLEKAGVLKLKDGAGIKATSLDIVSNPKNIKIVEVEAAQVPRTLDDVDAAVVNSNYAIGAGLNPLKDSLIIEDKDSPYVTVVASRAGDENKPNIRALVDTLQSEAAKKFMLEKFQGSVVPVGK